MGKEIYVCTSCDAQFPKWIGRCSECGKWGTVEKQIKKEEASNVSTAVAASPTRLSEVNGGGENRIHVGISECDRALGGGIVPGALILLGGDPGIGKSTLVAQMAVSLQKEVLYVSGEESATQVKMRFDRLGLDARQVHFLAEEHVETICKTILETSPAMVIIDSIHTMASSAVSSEPGSVNQIKATAVRLLEVAKSTSTPVIIISHVTKGGDISGPKTLEHIVDVVLYIEGDQDHQGRVLRSVKNRFGSTNEIGVFEMNEKGLTEIQTPSSFFIQERSRAAGSCITAVKEGSRIFLVEIQALVTKTVFGFPQRKSSGYDVNRLHVLLGVLGKRARVNVTNQDVYVNVVGGMQLKEPAMDAAVCLAVVSGLTDISLDPKMIAWGEVGLGGEVRSVPREEDRVKEAKRFGFATIISPPTCRTVEDALRAAKILQ